MLGVERLAVDRGDDVARLEAGLARPGRRGRSRAARPPGRTGPGPAPMGSWAPLPWPPLPWAPLPWPPLPASASAVGIHAPLSTGRLAACLTVGSMVSKRTPSHGRRSACPADAWASSGRAMLIGMAKPMPWLLPAHRGVDADDVAARVEQRAAAVARVDRGVGLDQVVEVAALDVDAPAERGDDAARDRVGELAERAADGDRLLADLDGRRVADRGRREAGLRRP